MRIQQITWLLVLQWSKLLPNKLDFCSGMFLLKQRGTLTMQSWMRTILVLSSLERNSELILEVIILVNSSSYVQVLRAQEWSSWHLCKDDAGSWKICDHQCRLNTALAMLRQAMQCLEKCSLSNAVINFLSSLCYVAERILAWMEQGEAYMRSATSQSGSQEVTEASAYNPSQGSLGPGPTVTKTESRKHTKPSKQKKKDSGGGLLGCLGCFH